MSDPLPDISHFLGPPAVAAIERFVSERVEAALAERAEQSPGRWLTGARQAADYLGCSEKRVYGRLHVIPHVRDGGRLVFHADELDAYLRRGKVT